jgi:DNA helicase-2/ATP-dependent DNA helicase PcrA
LPQRLRYEDYEQKARSRPKSPKHTRRKLGFLTYICKNEKHLSYLSTLNEAQHAAVTTPEGPIMIVAGAGSGKTRVLTFRIAHLIEHGVDPFTILALTFTNKAAKEMKERIAKVVGESESKQLMMGTFHSVFAKILRSEADRIGYPRNFTIYDSDDSKSLIRSIVSEQNLDDKVYKASLVLNRISSAKNGLITAAAYQQNTEFLQDDTYARRPKLGDLYTAYVQRCFRAGAMDFDDLLLKTYELFTRFPDVLYKYQQRFQFIMVDEFQDTNHAQYAVIRQLSALFQNICVVGDDAQSIYAFRGANIANILNFERDYPDLKVFKLEQNYRSTQTIVNAANAVIAKNKQQLPKRVWTSNSEGNKMKVFKAMSDTEEGYYVAQTIFEKHQSEQKPYSEFAILYRTNAQSRSLEESLRRNNIPYRIYGGLSFYQRKEIKDMISYLRLLVNPHDEEALRRVINYPARGIGKVTVDKMTVIAGENDTSLWNILEFIREGHAGVGVSIRTKLEEFSLMIRSFQERLIHEPAYTLASELARVSGLLGMLHQDKSPEGVSRYENVMELLNGIKEFSERENAVPEGVPPLAAFLEEVSLLTDNDKEDEPDSDKVALMTIHSAKGLEFPHVFIVGLEENLFPSQLSSSSRDELEEERRLFYVALTRAMEQVYLTFAQSRYRYGQLIYGEPSRFITEIDRAYLEMGTGGRAVQDPQKTPGLAKQYTIPNHSRLKKVSSTPSPSVSAEMMNRYTIGMKVNHSRFGKGEIIHIDGEGANKMATIFFETQGEKRLLLKFARLEIIS